MIVIMAVAAMLGIAAYFYTLPALFYLFLFFVLLFCMQIPRKYVFLAMITLSTYYCIAFLHNNLQQSKFTGTEESFIIRFSEVYKIDGASLQTFVYTNGGEKLLLRYTFPLESEKQQFINNYQLGVTCKISGKLEKPMAARNKNSFDYQTYLRHLNVYWLLKSENNPLAKCDSPKQNWNERIKTIRLKGLQHLEHHFSTETKAFAAALLFGESGWIDEETIDAYKKLSLIHILAISGLHVGIIAGGCFYIGIRLGITREVTKLIIISMLPLYCMIAGGAPSVVRACLMVMLFLLLSLWKKKLSPVVILCAVFMALLLYNPFYLFHVGFQLSFFITFALLMSAKILQQLQGSNAIVQSFAVTLICQLCSMPIILYYFHEVSVWGFIMNIIYIPVYTVILLPFTFFVFFLSVVEAPFFNVLVALLEFLFTLINKIAVMIASLPFTSLSFGKPLFLFFFILIALIIISFSFWESGKRKKALHVLVGCLLVLTLFYHRENFSPFGEIVFIDVGQGDSILIKLPYGRGVYLIDTGGLLNFSREEWQKKKKTFDPGGDIVVPFLKSIGITSIDKLIITHADADHMGGGLAVLQHISVKEIVIPETLKGDFVKTDFIGYARQQKLRITVVRAGDGWKVGKAQFYVLHPREEMSDSNENSLVLLAEINELKWLFTGDIGQEGEIALLKQYPRLKADVLKAGHHGSKTSSSPYFLDQIEAKVVIVSAGYNNRFGHPHPEVLSAFLERNMHVFRTDEQGAITYSYFWNKGTFSTMLP